MTREQIQSTLADNQRVWVRPAVGTVDKANPRDWNALIVTDNGKTIERKGTYGKTEQEALDNLALMLGLVDARGETLRVDQDGILQDAPTVSQIAARLFCGLLIACLLAYGIAKGTWKAPEQHWEMVGVSE